jgi:hypothetical protein
VATAAQLKVVKDPSNGGKHVIDMSQPYRASVTINGHADILFHRWNNEAVAEKAASAKGSAAKKSDNVESYVWRNEEGTLCLPGEYLRGSIVMAAKFHQDPRSPRKSAMDLFKAGVVSLTDLASFGVKDWDYLDRRRVVIQRNSVTRERPAMRKGWKATIDLMVTTPEYINPDFLQQVIAKAGLLVGVGDFRPTYGRFGVANFKILSD